MNYTVDALKKLWIYLLEVSGENDYSRYCVRAALHGRQPVSPREFYLDRLRHKYSGANRCC